MPQLLSPDTFHFKDGSSSRRKHSAISKGITIEEFLSVENPYQPTAIDRLLSKNKAALVGDRMKKTQSKSSKKALTAANKKKNLRATKVAKRAHLETKKSTCNGATKNNGKKTKSSNPEETPEKPKAVSKGDQTHIVGVTGVRTQKKVSDTYDDGKGERGSFATKNVLPKMCAIKKGTAAQSSDSKKPLELKRLKTDVCYDKRSGNKENLRNDRKRIFRESETSDKRFKKGDGNDIFWAPGQEPPVLSPVSCDKRAIKQKSRDDDLDFGKRKKRKNNSESLTENGEVVEPEKKKVVEIMPDTDIPMISPVEIAKENGDDDNDVKSICVNSKSESMSLDSFDDHELMPEKRERWQTITYSLIAADRLSKVKIKAPRLTPSVKSTKVASVDEPNAGVTNTEKKQVDTTKPDSNGISQSVTSEGSVGTNSVVSDAGKSHGISQSVTAEGSVGTNSVVLDAGKSHDSSQIVTSEDGIETNPVVLDAGKSHDTSQTVTSEDGIETNSVVLDAGKSHGTSQTVTSEDGIETNSVVLDAEKSHSTSQTSEDGIETNSMVSDAGKSHDTSQTSEDDIETNSMVLDAGKSHDTSQTVTSEDGIETHSVVLDAGKSHGTSQTVTSEDNTETNPVVLAADGKSHVTSQTLTSEDGIQTNSVVLDAGEKTRDTVQTVTSEDGIETNSVVLDAEKSRRPPSDENHLAKENVFKALGLQSNEEVYEKSTEKESQDTEGNERSTDTLKATIKTDNDCTRMEIKPKERRSLSPESSQKENILSFYSKTIRSHNLLKGSPGRLSSYTLNNEFTNFVNSSIETVLINDSDSSPNGIDFTVHDWYRPMDNTKDNDKIDSLIVPEKSSSFSIHPDRLCSDVCKYCFGKFGLYDTPCHVAQLKNSERQENILIREPNLKTDTCLCDRCFRFVARKANSPLIQRNKGIRRSMNPSTLCAVENCDQIARHYGKRKWRLKIEKKIPNLSFDDKRRGSRMNFGLCSLHYSMVDLYITCGICKKQSNRNDMYSIKSELDNVIEILRQDRIPINIADNMLLCKNCYHCMFLRLTYGHPTNMSFSNQQYYESFKEEILRVLNVNISDNEDKNSLEGQIVCNGEDKNSLEGEGVSNSECNNSLERQIVCNGEDKNSLEGEAVSNSEGNNSLEGQIVCNGENKNSLEGQIVSNSSEGNNSLEGENNESDSRSSPERSKAKRDEHATESSTKPNASPNNAEAKKTHDVGIHEIAYLFKPLESYQSNDNNSTHIKLKFGNLNIGKLSNLNIGQNAEPKKHEESGCGEAKLPTQFDKATKRLWRDLQKPYGDQSSFMRHLIMMEKYWRSGALTLAETADPDAVKYVNSVKNRIKSQQKSSSPTKMTTENMQQSSPPLQKREQSSTSQLQTHARSSSPLLQTGVRSSTPSQQNHVRSSSIQSRPQTSLEQLAQSWKALFAPPTLPAAPSVSRPSTIFSASPPHPPLPPKSPVKTFSTFSDANVRRPSTPPPLLKLVHTSSPLAVRKVPVCAVKPSSEADAQITKLTTTSTSTAHLSPPVLEKMMSVPCVPASKIAVSLRQHKEMNELASAPCSMSLLMKHLTENGNAARPLPSSTVPVDFPSKPFTSPLLKPKSSNTSSLIANLPEALTILEVDGTTVAKDQSAMRPRPHIASPFLVGEEPSVSVFRGVAK